MKWKNRVETKHQNVRALVGNLTSLHLEWVSFKTNSICQLSFWFVFYSEKSLRRSYFKRPHPFSQHKTIASNRLYPHEMPIHRRTGTIRLGGRRPVCPKKLRSAPLLDCRNQSFTPSKCTKKHAFTIVERHKIVRNRNTVFRTSHTLCRFTRSSNDRVTKQATRSSN